MKVVSYNSLSKNKKQKKIKIYCIGKVFKPLVFVMSAMILLLITNLLVNNFFTNIEASLQNFVESFVNIFQLLKW